MFYCGMGSESKWYIIRVLNVSFVRGNVDDAGDSCVGTAPAPLPSVEIFAMSVRRRVTSQSALSELYLAG